MSCHREFRQQIFGPLRPPPWRPFVGAGATVGPIRAAIICGGIALAPNTTAGPAKSELIPPHSAPPAALREIGPADPVSVPEPGSAALLAAALAGLWIARKR